MKKYKCIILFILLFSLPKISHSFIGDIQYSINPNIGNNITFDSSNNHFLYFSSNSVTYYDYTGLFVKRVNMSGQANSSFAFDRGFSILDSQRLVGVGILNGLTNQLSIWRIQLDGNNNEILVLESSADLSAYSDIKNFNRSPDGSYWFLNNSSDTLNHLSSNYTLISSVDIQVPFIGLPGQAGSNDNYTPTLTVESNTGNLILIAKGNVIDETQLSNLATETTIYYLNPSDLSVIGRFQADLLTSNRGITAGNGLFYFNNSGVTGYELSPASPPVLVNFKSDLTSLVWRRCERDFNINFNTDPTINVDVNWIDNNDGVIAFDGLNMFIPSNDVTSDQNFDLTYILNDNLLFTNPTPQGQIELVNEDDQSSGLIDVSLDFNASYALGLHSGFPFGCSFYGYSEETVLGGGEIGKWTLARKFPNTAIDVSVEFDEAFPFLGGKTFGVEGLQLDFEAGIVGQGTDKVTMSGGGVFKAGIGEIGFKAGLGATTELTQDEILFDKGLFNFQISGILKAEQPLLEVIPPLAALANTPFIGRVLKVVTNAAKAVAEISLTADTTVLASVPDGTLSSLCIEGKEELILGLKVGVIIELMEGIAELSIFGGGNSKVSWQSVPGGCPEMAFNEFVIQMYLTGRYILYGATATYEQIHSIKYPFPTVLNATKVKTVKDEWSYAYKGNTRFNKSEVIPKLVNSNPFEAIKTRAQIGATNATNQIPVLSGIGQDAKPVSAFAPDGTGMLLWIQERTDLPPTQATEIFYSYYNGQTFSNPTAISLNTKAEFQPVIAYHKSGKWLAAWTQVRDSNLPSTGAPQADAIAQSRQLSPIYSVFNPTSLSWTPPLEVPDIFINNTFLDIIETGTSYMLRIATGPQNEIALLWLTNFEQNQFPYDIDAATFTSSNYVYWSLFDGTEFNLTGTMRQGSRTQFLAMNLTGAFDGDQLLIGFGEPFGSYTSPTYFIFKSPTPTNPFATFTRPGFSTNFSSTENKLIFTKSGEIALISSIGNQIYFRRGTDPHDLGGRLPIFIDETNNSQFNNTNDFRDSFEVGETSDGKLFIVAPDIRNGNPDIVFAIEDANTPAKSLKGLFEGGSIAEKYLSTTTNADGDVVVFYYQARLEQDRVTLDLGDGDQEFQRTREPNSGQIMMAIHEINTDLTVTNVNNTNGLSEEGHHATAFATVFNTGDKPIENPKISLYARDIGVDKSKRGADITIVENLIAKDGWLAAGDKVEVSIPWTLPDSTEYQVYAIVDPENEVQEYNEQDNQNSGPAADFIYRNGFELIE